MKLTNNLRSLDYDVFIKPPFRLPAFHPTPVGPMPISPHFFMWVVRPNDLLIRAVEESLEHYHPDFPLRPELYYALFYNDLWSQWDELWKYLGINQHFAASRACRYQIWREKE